MYKLGFSQTRGMDLAMIADPEPYFKKRPNRIRIREKIGFETGLNIKIQDPFDIMQSNISFSINDQTE